MDHHKTTLERSFELAKSGDVHSLKELYTRLNSEGYLVSQLVGPTLLKQLKKLIILAQE